MLLVACAPTVSLDAADDAADPTCAQVSVALPEALGQTSTDGPFAERATDAQATAAWGEPTVVTLRCGVPEPAPTTDLCSSIDGIDWIQVADEGGVRTFVTYGRTPAIEVVIDTTQIAPTTVLQELASAVGETQAVGGCVAASDATPAPSTTAEPSTEPEDAEP